MNQLDSNLEKGLADCNVPGPDNLVNIDPIPRQCDDDGWPTQRRVGQNPAYEWKQRPSQAKRGPQWLGQSGNCDPIQSGQIINDLDAPDRETVFRYSRALRGANEAMLDLFRNIKVLDEDGGAHVVRTQWASQEKAVAALLQDNYRKDPTAVVDRIRLPMLALYASGHALDMRRFTYQRNVSWLPWLDCALRNGFVQQEKAERDTIFGVTRGLPVDISYTLYAWTLYQEDMDQILEQVMLRFSPVAYLNIRGVWWEVIVTMDGMENNLNPEVGDKKQRVLKYQFRMTAKSYLPQPIIRREPPPPDPFAELEAAGLTAAEIAELRG